jgi:hypothetical protein
LERKIAIYGNKYFELLFGQYEEIAILDSRPTHLRDGFDVMTVDRRRKPPIDAFVE